MVSTAFFDIFGFFAFVAVLILGILILKSYKKVPDWIGSLLLIIGLAGMLVDGIIVIKTYILGG